MIPPSHCILALVTAPDMDVARKIARAALEQKLAACANILPQLESHYWWEGKLEQSSEVLVIFKTAEPLRERLQQCVLANHPYQTPEFIAFLAQGGSSDYLKWIRNSVDLP